MALLAKIAGQSTTSISYMISSGGSSSKYEMVLVAKHIPGKGKKNIARHLLPSKIPGKETQEISGIYCLQPPKRGRPNNMNEPSKS